MSRGQIFRLNILYGINSFSSTGCFSTDIIGSCAFGLECNSFKEPDSPFRHYGKKIFETSPKLQSFIRILLIQNHHLARALGLRQTNKEVSAFFTKVVEDTIAYREKNNYVRNDFLQLLINARDKDDGKGMNGKYTSLAGSIEIYFWTITRLV